MGGTKCTYRNCTSKSDGVTHMFHYPVFDKVRCHQWLSNAHRLEFLNLKVSQLKNRVVCQHHFKPDNFMNIKMDKLKFNAVPTENGPYCNVEDWEKDDIPNILPIGADEIENDQLTTTEKLANYPLKYGDFLINSEIQIDDKQLRRKPQIRKSRYQPLYSKSESPKPISNEKQKISQKIEFENPNKEIEVPVILKTEVNEPLIFKPPQPPEKRKSHVRILSEKTLETPLMLTGELKPVEPNLILKIPPKKVEYGIVDNIENMEVLIHNPELKSVEIVNDPEFYQQIANNPQNLQLEYCIQPSESVSSTVFANTVDTQTVPDITQTPITVPIEQEPVQSERQPLKSDNCQSSNEQPPRSSSLKNKMPPEKLAAIEKKRKFNQKLRDMIALCLEDNPEKLSKDLETNQVKQKAPVKPKLQDRNTEHIATLDDINNAINVKENTSQSSERHPIAVSEWALSSLESRLKRMEENIMMKIEENTRNIAELKRKMETEPPAKPQHSKPQHSIPTNKDEEISKKQLFNEISKYLSPEANNLVYEELFLEQYLKTNVEYTSKFKRRKLKGDF